MLCPVPIIRLARAASTRASGSVIELLTDDPAAEYDVPAWCRLRGHELLTSEPLESDVPIDPTADPRPTPENTQARSRTAPTRTPVRPCAT